ncbi:MAG: 23S rRNA (pseudouridine(1915)-N(3))-methyltransferase RlmH [Pseudomonadota bacterium]
MQLVIAAVGRAKRKAEAELVAHYLKQTRWDVVVKEIPDAPSNLSADARRAREAAAFQPLLGPGSRLMAMDSTGKSLTSPQFAQAIQAAQGHAIKQLVFAIGGQDGLDASLLKTAHTTLAFGAATWPHQLLRAMLAEQIFRAYSITVGHPYHLGH